MAANGDPVEILCKTCLQHLRHRNCPVADLVLRLGAHLAQRDVVSFRHKDGVIAVTFKAARRPGDLTGQYAFKDFVMPIRPSEDQRAAELRAARAVTA